MSYVSFIASKDIPSAAADFFKKLLEHISSDVSLHEYKLPVMGTRGENKWPCEMVSDILANPFVVQGPLFEKGPHPQKDIVRGAINPHSTVCGIWGPGALKLFLVSQPKIFDSVWSENQYRFKCTIRTALELAEARGASHIYEVGFLQRTDVWPESAPKRISISQEEFIRRVLQDPSNLHVALVSPELGQFIEILCKTMMEAATCSIEMGKNHLFLPIQENSCLASVMVACSLFCHYAGMEERSQMLESLLDHYYQPLRTGKESEVGTHILGLIQQMPRTSSSNTIHHLFHIWRNLSPAPHSTVGFDIWILPSTDPRQVGEALQELILPYPFDLVGIACQGVEIYPFRAVPSLTIEEALQCRFSVSKSTASVGKDVSRFISELSRIYPWIRVSLYRDWSETMPFLSLVKAS